ncbi:molybdenum cofactor sulfurase-like [Rhopilema esculentum]|uniref:molybdenum cofactor sulfurase-like n=1 Tax=Rhopilema esculentum TaxID=499914 RepID=UPI0031E19A44|eukprot:gene14603-5682_t
MAERVRTSEKIKFLEQFGGYNGTVEELRETEFSRLTGVYLDNIGATLYSKSQIENHLSDLNNNLFGNPHSGSSCSQRSTDLIEEARNIVARHFNTTLEKHHVVFTSGATAALRMVAENFNWTKESHFVFLQDNHTSVVGIREIAREQGSEIVCITEEALNSSIKESCFRVQNGSVGVESDVHDSNSDLLIENKGQKLVGVKAKGNEDLEALKLVPDEVYRSSDQIDEETGLRFEQAKSTFDEQNAAILDQHVNIKCAKHSKNSKQARDKSIHSKINAVDDTRQVASLFAFPAMSNFCGRKYPLEWTDLSKQGVLFPFSKPHGRWYVLLDAASYVGTNELDLSKINADFVPISFYKIFGYPTGIGALIMRTDAVESFRPKCYYGGGTVYSTFSATHHRVFRDEVSDRYEDGTSSFLNIIALKHGFYSLKSHAGPMLAISDHTFALTQYTYKEMKSMRHFSGIHLCKIYSDMGYDNIKSQGPVINFNLISSNGDYIGYSQVDKLASLSNIHLRTGCFCNTGDCQKHLCLSDDQLLSNYNAGHVCGDQMDIIDGLPTGSVRISFGYMSCFEDAWTFLSFLKDCFLVPIGSSEIQSELSNAEVYEDLSKSAFDVQEAHSALTGQQTINFDEPHDVVCNHRYEEQSPSADETEDASCHANIENQSLLDQSPKCFLKRIYVYPVKSCAAFEVSKWTVSDRGLLYDREWMIITEYGSVLTQKKEPRMVFIKPAIDINKGVLILSCEGYSDVAVPLEKSVCKPLQAHDREHCLSRVCGQRVSCDDCGDEVAGWLGHVLGVSCRLVRQNTGQKRFLKSKSKDNNQTDISNEEHELSLSNESQYLLISENSLLQLFNGFQRSREYWNLFELAASFRGNFLVCGNSSFEEDTWKEVNIGVIRFKTSGKCQRCQMICINQKTAIRNREPLETLVRMRGSRMEFGIYLVAKNVSSGECAIQVGDEVFAAPP